MSNKFKQENDPFKVIDQREAVKEHLSEKNQVEQENSLEKQEVYIEKTKKALQEFELLKKRKEIKTSLPHLYLFKDYEWSKAFFESENKQCFLTAANQIGKSSIQIRKMIHWATNKNLWPRLWPHMTPNLFWYLYPTSEVATVEFYTKWMQFLPKNGAENSKIYGWKVEKKKDKDIKAIHFNSGVSIYFKTYMQQVQNLQSGTVFYVACDEELPVSYFPELQARTRATNGYFSLVFTATTGQIYWYKCMERQGMPDETHKNAFKLQVSLYDCQKYIDGSLSHWTDKVIKQAINECPTDAEVQRRIYGKFVKATGLKYPSFNFDNNVKEKASIKRNQVYGSVDIGSGGESGHPAAITFIAVNEDFTKGELFLSWRGDGVVTSSGDILQKYLSLKKEHKFSIVSQVYDWASADFSIVAQKASEYFEKANKKKEEGDSLLNTLFKFQMLDIITDHEDAEKLIEELISLDIETKKTHAKDDLIDSLKYNAMQIPWDFSKLPLPSFLNKKKQKKQIITVDDERKLARKILLNKTDGNTQYTVHDELCLWGDMYDV